MMSIWFDDFFVIQSLSKEINFAGRGLLWNLEFFRTGNQKWVREQ